MKRARKDTVHVAGNLDRINSFIDFTPFVPAGTVQEFGPNSVVGPYLDLQNIDCRFGYRPTVGDANGTTLPPCYVTFFVVEDVLATASTPAPTIAELFRLNGQPTGTLGPNYMSPLFVSPRNDRYRFHLLEHMYLPRISNKGFDYASAVISVLSPTPAIPPAPPTTIENQFSGYGFDGQFLRVDRRFAVVGRNVARTPAAHPRFFFGFWSSVDTTAHWDGCFSIMWTTHYVQAALE